MPKYLVYIFLLSNLRELPGTILPGSRAQSGQFPWLVQFHTILPCGGVLISPDWVLTAAQCVQKDRNSIVLHATGLNGTGTNQSVSVKATYIYPDFDFHSKPRDHDKNIALLKLVKAFDMCDSRVRLLEVAPLRLDEEYKSCLIFGWQSTVAPSTKVHAQPIQYSSVLLNSWFWCGQMYDRKNTSYKNLFCTMIVDDNGTKICAGNPGSPVVCEDRYQRLVLLGIASWSNFLLDCGGLPAYLGVAPFRSWMRNLIFGNRDGDGWEISPEVGACQRESRFDGFGKNLPVHRVRNFSDEAKRISAGFTRLPGSDVGPSILHRIEDYPGAPKERRIIKDPDGFRENEEGFESYRESGRIDSRSREDPDEEPVAVPSQRGKKFFRPPNEPGKTNFDNSQEENDNFDVLELVMPDGVEIFDRSPALFFRANLIIVFFALFSSQVFTLF